MRLNIKALAIAGAIVWGGGFFLVGLLNLLFRLLRNRVPGAGRVDLPGIPRARRLRLGGGGYPIRSARRRGDGGYPGVAVQSLPAQNGGAGCVRRAVRRFGQGKGR
ncbi:MAG: hypothetical protein KatS3mg081_1588 [Gemmatimonadales bacterium]|nr:MAG: hypothetical protein KatS3mg081_1588 [Gemmatimonadales bacterium]